MDPTQPSPSAGQFVPAYEPSWYPDPTHRFEYRYHNGSTWTGDVALNGNRYLDALPLTPTPIPGASASRPGNGRAIAAFVLALCSVVAGAVPFVCVFAAAAAILAIILAIGSLRRDRQLAADGLAVSHGRGLAIAGLVLAPIGLVASALGVWFSVLVIREVDAFTNVGIYSYDSTSCAVNDGIAVFTGTITNESSDTHTYRVEVDFVRPSTDNVLYNGVAHARDVGPHVTKEWEVRVPVSEDQLDCRVDSITGPLPFVND